MKNLCENSLLLFRLFLFIDVYFCYFPGSVGGGDTSCTPGMFRCQEGKCIPSLWVCNYQKDCEKGEDEFQSCREYFFNYLLFLFYYFSLVVST
jgi:hypothetical protein